MEARFAETYGGQTRAMPPPTRWGRSTIVDRIALIVVASSLPGATEGSAGSLVGAREFAPNIQASATSKHPDAISLEVDMRRGWIGLALGALTIVSASFARADDIGCCEAQCRTSDGSGRGTVSATRLALTREDCESRFANCDTTWNPDVCAAPGPGVPGAVGGSVHRIPDAEE
jgi:hypothetical protein